MILTLTILAVVLLLLIAFVTSMRTERMIAKNYNDLAKARFIADAAVDQAVATIKNATPIIDPANTYVSSPGAIYKGSGSPATWTTVPLYTTIGSSGSIDLNVGDMITGSNAVYSTTGHTSLFVGWSDVVIGGELTGRFAYWVDDESTKVNINTARTRGSDLEGTTPAAIDLQALFSPSDQSAINSFVATFFPFDTVESIKFLGTLNGSINAADWYTNKFYMTVNSSSYDLTPWGDKKLNLVQLVTNTAVSTSDKINAIVNALSDPKLGTWFGGQAFEKKYPNLQQIAANIIDYIDTDLVPTDSGSQADITPPAYLGLEQTPYINELQFSNYFDIAYNIVTVGPTLITNAVVTLNSITRVELWNMYASSWSNPSPSSTEVLLIGRPDLKLTPVEHLDTTSSSSNWVPTASVTFAVTNNNLVADGYIISPALNEGSFTFTVTGFPTTINFSGGIVTAIFRTATSRLDYQLIPVDPQTFTIQAYNSPPAGTYYRNRNAEANDPRARASGTLAWNALASGSQGSIGSQNSSLNRQITTTNVVAPAVGIRADGDATCHTNTVFVRDRGAFFPSELAFIHTGVPWRTFWLQPQYPTELTAIPDWAAVDIFSGSDLREVQGRMNVNAWISPSVPSILPPRFAPLSALLTNRLGVSTQYDKGSVLTNLYDAVPDLSNVVARFPAFSRDAFIFAGEVCEVSGLATNNVSSGNSNKARFETPARGIVNIITTRSNQFTIWAIAQSIKKVDTGSPTTFVSGTDLITGEVKVQAIVERYEEGGQVKFRTKYFRYIYE